MKIPEKCKKCMHRINDFCKAHKEKLELLTIENCTYKKKSRRRDRK
ncbi:hypothetical protein LCGC14_1096500 [marine sediment metagenome]|uniref:Uncharacterized protein n=1 Tax=marine sediment metagenome TaxID=412755 RepID=A0A0F9QGT4_9ZZZZ